jgi:hypothetical protein
LTIIYNVKSPNEENLYGEPKTPKRYEAFIREGAKESYERNGIKANRRRFLGRLSL